MTYANANVADLGLVAGKMTPVTTNQTAFSTMFNPNIAAKNAAQAKDLARTNRETVLRSAVRKSQGTATVTNAQRQSLGISLRNTGRTSVGAPTSRRILPWTPASVCGTAFPS